MTARLDSTFGDGVCFLCSGQGPFREDSSLMTLYASLKGNPDRMRGFLKSGTYTPCAALQIYIMTADRDLGIALLDHCLENPLTSIPPCHIRDIMKIGRNSGDNGIKGKSTSPLGWLGSLVEETLYRSSRDNPLSAFGTENPRYTDYKQTVIDHIFTAEDEANPDSLRLAEKPKKLR